MAISLKPRQASAGSEASSQFYLGRRDRRRRGAARGESIASPRDIMAAESAPSDLRYLEPIQATIDGVRCEDMTVRAATGGVLGRLQGFIVDPVARQLRYFVVRTSGIMGRSRLLPVIGARFDLEHRAIELLTN